MRIEWHREASQELIDAAKFYDRRVPGLGSDFLEEIETAVQRIVATPTSFSVVEDAVRRCRVPRFPYCLYFIPKVAFIRILAVRHHARHPDYWKARQ